MISTPFWTGLRPMTPDGTPILGGTPFPNLQLSTGHGTLGWTMAAGTGRVMADLISGALPLGEAVMRLMSRRLKSE